MSFIVLERISKSFGKRVVVNDLSLRIDKAERLVLFGPSGCGKTTVLRLVAGLETPDRGTIELRGRIVASSGKIIAPPEERSVGMVFQDLALWPHMSVRGNLMFGLRGRGISQTEADVRVHDMLHRVRLETRVHEKPHELSGGEQQRVALARALVMQPSILLMDEPLSNLDQSLKEAIIADLLRLHAQIGFTLVYVTHDRAEANALASKTLLMSEGQLI